MVKRQKEKQYQSAREQREYSQIRSGSASTLGTSGVQRRLPFSHCALTLTPYETPVCLPNGIIFENSAIMGFILEHKIDPVTGKPLTSRDLITLNMDKDEEGRWQCPVLTKPFADHTKIVAIRRGNEANVYSYEAYHELNVKAKNYEDLISGEKFDKKKDVIILNDPTDDEWNQRRDINSFYHVKHGRELNKSRSVEVRHSVTATRIMDQLKKNKKEEETAQKKRSAKNDSEKDSSLLRDGKRLKIYAKDVTGVQYSTGKAAVSLTSTAMDVSYENDTREATQEEILQSQFRLMRKLKKKGYVRLRTSMGDLTLEIHCDIVPRTCCNFLGLCQAGAYDRTKFHRVIKNFMAQGGKAKDGHDRSLWGDTAFEDEFDDRLKHTGMGVVSMANSGPASNRQQFFITFKSCNHLDRKHSVFGNVIDGTDVLKKMEHVPTDKKERPMEEIKILATEVVEDPAQEARDLEQRRFEERAKADKKKESLASQSTKGQAPPTSKASGPSVGRYLQEKLRTSTKDALQERTEVPGDAAVASRLPSAPKKSTFGDFSGW